MLSKSEGNCADKMVKQETEGVVCMFAAVCIFGGISVLFVIIMIVLNIKVYMQSKSESKIPFGYIGNSVNEDDKKEILEPLYKLKEGYVQRDIQRVDQYVDEIMETEDILILGTNPREVFKSREEVINLLYGDWKYWGDVRLDVDNTALHRIGDVAFFALKGDTKLDIWRIRIPVKITGVLVKKESRWLINKMQFVADFNSNYIIFSLLAALAATFALAVFAGLFVIYLLK